MSIRNYARRAIMTVQELASLSDWPSRLRMSKLRLQQLRQGEVSNPPADSAVPVNVKALAGGPLFIRPRSSDIDMIWDTFVADWHLPPPEVQDRPLRRIVELGTNIGTGLAGLAARYPEATLLGVEPDPQNAALARRNLAQFGDRSRIVQAAIWDVDADLVVERTRREWGLVVRPREATDPPEWPTVPAQSAGSVLADFEPGEPIDFMFVDIEGTEQRILEADDTEWAQRVRCIRVECEYHYKTDVRACCDALVRLGFDVQTEAVSWATFVFGVRPDPVPTEATLASRVDAG